GDVVANPESVELK
nr:RecName: Full=Unknown protein 6 [Ginkgo biloba]